MKTLTITNEDYSRFSQEALRKSLNELIQECKSTTGASDEEISIALREVAKKVMNTNFLKEPRDEPTFIWYCDKCGYELAWKISDLSHSNFGFYDCLACKVKSGERVPFSSITCPVCANK